jgi:hypothetical protein
MPISPRTQYTINNDSPFLQANNQVFVFSTLLANQAAESVLKSEYPNIIEYHKSLPSTAQYLSVSEDLTAVNGCPFGRQSEPVERVTMIIGSRERFTFLLFHQTKLCYVSVSVEQHQ